MHQERGNFLLQSLLALGFIFAFIPMLSRQLNERNIDINNTEIKQKQAELEPLLKPRLFGKKKAEAEQEKNAIISIDEYLQKFDEMTLDELR